MTFLFDHFYSRSPLRPDSLCLILIQTCILITVGLVRLPLVSIVGPLSGEMRLHCRARTSMGNSGIQVIDMFLLSYWLWLCFQVNFVSWSSPYVWPGNTSLIMFHEYFTHRGTSHVIIFFYSVSVSSLQTWCWCGFASRCVSLAVAILGVLKCGAAYSMMDPKYPTERFVFIIRY